MIVTVMHAGMYHTKSQIECTALTTIGPVSATPQAVFALDVAVRALRQHRDIYRIVGWKC